MRKVLGFVAMSAVGMVPVFSQEPPAGPPPVLQIMREVIKEGKGAAHQKTETEFVRAFRKPKFPGHYLALTAMSGMGEVWFLDPYPSFATWEQYQKEQDKEPLKSELEMAESHDGALCVKLDRTEEYSDWFNSHEEARKAVRRISGRRYFMQEQNVFQAGESGEPDFAESRYGPAMPGAGAPVALVDRLFEPSDEAPR